MLKLVLGRADKIIITSKKQLNSPFLKNYEKKTVIIPPGVDTKRFRSLNVKKEENTIFFLSVLDRYHRYKGLDYLLNALRLVKNDIKDVKLIVGGDGELLEYYKDMVRYLGLKDNVSFVGHIPDEKILSYYNRSELFVLPSLSSVQEGFGIVLLEAMACGIPVVSTDVVGLAEEIKKEKAGIIIRPRDAEALADAILRMLKTKPSRNTTNLAKRYEWSKITKKISKIYSSLF
jgi:glycosyltransferase involved in cell wall biosynthesis